MTPGARLAAAAAVLDAVIAGQPAEQALIRWARSSRFAGSGDRAAVRDHVFDALRRRRSAAWLGGTETGRGLILGLLRLSGVDPAAFFTGLGHAPHPPEPQEAGRPWVDAPPEVQADLPDWLWLRFLADHGQAAPVLAEALRHRAPLFLRVNLARGTRAEAEDLLAREGVETVPHPSVETALRVTAGGRGVAATQAYLQGLVELQDAASQAAVLALPFADGQTVLDFCAGGGGKTLAMAARARLGLTAHDSSVARMADLPARAARAGVQVSITDTPQGRFDLVLVDAPCSGSGTWRRAPEAKWRLTPEGLAELSALQQRILAKASRHVAPGGFLAYATCSVLTCENDHTVAAFAGQHPGWRHWLRRIWLPDDQGDGFYLAVMQLSQE